MVVKSIEWRSSYERIDTRVSTIQAGYFRTY